MRCKHLLYGGLIGEIPYDQLAAGHRPAVACGQVVEDHNIMPCLAQLPNYMAAYIPGSAGHQNFHDCDCSFPDKDCLRVR